MGYLPLIQGTNAGLKQAMTAADTDTVVPVPEGAMGVLLWFATEADPGAYLPGRIGIDPSATPLGALADDALGYLPAGVARLELRQQHAVWAARGGALYLHLSSPVAGATVYGMWLYR